MDFLSTGNCTTDSKEESFEFCSLPLHFKMLCDLFFLVCVRKENDIFLGWEKGTGKKWGKSKKKGGTDLSLEEMKKQAAVQCLRSASDEVSFLLLGSCNSAVVQLFIMTQLRFYF